MKNFCLILIGIFFLPLLSLSQPNQHLHFDGINDYITATQQTSVSNNFTIELWVRPSKTTNLPTQATSGASGSGSSNSYAIFPENGSNIGTNAAGMGLAVGTNGICIFEHGSGYLPSLLTWSGTISSIIWTHVAIVYTNKQPKLYINGTLTATGLTSAKTNVYPTTSRLGGGTYGYYQGGIDEMRLWNYSLTATEISSRMNSELLGNESGLFVHYKFNEGSTLGINTGLTTLLDNKKAYNGTLNNFALTGSTSNWIYSAQPLPVSAPVANEQTFCSTSTVANLVAAGTAIKWYTTSTGGTALATSTSLLDGTTYYASQTVSGYESAIRTAVLVTIGAPNINYTGVNNNYCLNNTINTLSLTNTGGTPMVNNVTTFVGSGSSFGATDGLGLSATFYNPLYLVTDATGNIYVADNGNKKIRKITNEGMVSTFASPATTDFSSYAVATDATGNVYVVDNGNNKIRKITPAGVITVLAGSGVQSSVDGIGTEASFNHPTGIATDVFGNTFVTEGGGYKIRKITPEGIVTTLAGSGNKGSSDGIGIAASFYVPKGIATDATGNIYVADGLNNKIRKITQEGVVTTLAGSGSPGSTDGIGTLASFDYPTGITTDTKGNIYVTDGSAYKVRKITPSGVVTTLAGSGSQSSIDGVGTSASFQFPAGIATDALGNIYVADGNAHKIRKISPYSISPALPTGLNFNSATGAISGVPTKASSNTIYTISANNQCGTNKTNITFATTAKPSGPITSNQSFCNSATVANLVATGTAIKWYSTTSGGTTLDNTTALTNSTTYYASQTILGCESTRNKVDVTTVDCNNIHAGTTNCYTASLKNVQGNSWFNFVSSSGIIASLNPNGMNLGTVTVEVGDAGNTVTFDNKKFLSRSLNFTSSNYPNGVSMPNSYLLRFYHNDSELTDYNMSTNGAFALSDFNIIWRQSGVGCSLPAYGGTTTGMIEKNIVTEAEYGPNDNGFYLEIGLNHFTIFAATTSLGTTVPLELVSFKGYSKDNSCILEWHTETEQNSSHFELENSLNGIDFEILGQVKAKGQGSSYNFTHHNFSTQYYRLKMVDNDGSYTFSKVISLSDNKAKPVEIYPNPAKNNIRINVSNYAQPMRLFNINGVLIMSQNQVSEYLDMSQLPIGMYFLHIGTDILKVIKE
jgi:sugar lactone lactonase YvrE